MCQYRGLQCAWFCDGQKRTQAFFINNEAAARAVKDINSTTTLQAMYTDGWCSCSSCNNENAGSGDQSLNPQAPEFVPGMNNRPLLSAIGHPDYAGSEFEFEPTNVVVPDIEEVKQLFEEFSPTRATVSLNQPPDTNCIHVSNAPTELISILFTGLQGFRNITKSSENVYVQFADPNLTWRALRTLENLLTLGKLGIAGDIVKRALEGVVMILKIRRGGKRGSESPSPSGSSTPAVEKEEQQDNMPVGTINNPVFDASKGPFADEIEFMHGLEADEASLVSENCKFLRAAHEQTFCKHLWCSADAVAHYLLHRSSTQKVRNAAEDEGCLTTNTTFRSCALDMQEKKMHDFANHWLLKVKEKDEQLRNKETEIAELKTELQTLKDAGSQGNAATVECAPSSIKIWSFTLVISLMRIRTKSRKNYKMPRTPLRLSGRLMRRRCKN